MSLHHEGDMQVCLQKAFQQKWAKVDTQPKLIQQNTLPSFLFQGLHLPVEKFRDLSLDRTLNFGSSPECRIHVSYSLHFDTWKLGCKVDHTKSLG